MQIHRGRHPGAARRGEKNFTGTVLLDTLAAEADGSISIYDVFFEPGARTYWHRHPNGQVLLVKAGEGRVQSRGGEVETIRAGDVVHAAPNEEHWHGGGKETYLLHTAISLGVTQWGEEADAGGQR
jgi:quercetin dioxygenase-like cupin family protein